MSKDSPKCRQVKDGAIGKVFLYKLRPGKKPKAQQLCLAVGAAEPTAICS